MVFKRNFVIFYLIIPINGRSTAVFQLRRNVICPYFIKANKDKRTLFTVATLVYGKHIFYGADFIRQTYYPCFFILRNTQVKRKHMLSYYIAFDIVQFKVSRSVFKRGFSMFKAVPLMRFFRDMPIVQIIVVQERAAYQRPHIRGFTPLFGEFHAFVSNVHRMAKAGLSAVMTKLLLFLHFFGRQNITPVFIDQVHYTLNLSCSSKRFAGIPLVLVISASSSEVKYFSGELGTLPLT